jgi:hypothetical protein
VNRSIQVPPVPDTAFSPILLRAPAVPPNRTIVEVESVDGEASLVPFHNPLKSDGMRF